jgi:hypothetical protein
VLRHFNTTGRQQPCMARHAVLAWLHGRVTLTLGGSGLVENPFAPLSSRKPTRGIAERARKDAGEEKALTLSSSRGAPQGAATKVSRLSARNDELAVLLVDATPLLSAVTLHALRLPRRGSSGRSRPVRTLRFIAIGSILLDLLSEARVSNDCVAEK